MAYLSKKEAEKRVKQSGWGVYDTRTYRYTERDGVLVRIRLEYVGTTAALDRQNWEIVK